MKLDQRVVIVIGAGQTPGETIGNGRAASILFAREGARLLLVDNRALVDRNALPPGKSAYSCPDTAHRI